MLKKRNRRSDRTDSRLWPGFGHNGR